MLRQSIQAVGYAGFSLLIVSMWHSVSAEEHAYTGTMQDCQLVCGSFVALTSGSVVTGSVDVPNSGPNQSFSFTEADNIQFAFTIRNNSAIEEDAIFDDAGNLLNPFTANPLPLNPTLARISGSGTTDAIGFNNGEIDIRFTAPPFSSNGTTVNFNLLNGNADGFLFSGVFLFAQIEGYWDNVDRSPAIVVTPAIIDLVPTLLGIPQILGINVRNEGLLPLAIGLIAQSESLSPPFSILQDQCSNNFLNENQSCEITVQFLPTQLGNFSDSFDIPSNAPDNPVVIVMLSGGGSGDLGCAAFDSLDLPQPIPGDATAQIISTINVSNWGYITDLGVISLQGLHTSFNDLSFVLQSPTGTEITIMERSCGDEDNFDLNLDDAAANSWPCPPTTGDTYQPSNSFSAFDGEFSEGIWQLTVNDEVAGDGGSLESWRLRICAELLPDFDLDGFADMNDNCIEVVNPDQRDTNSDGYGNLCDADLNNDGTINFVDLAHMREVFFTSADEDADLSGDNFVNFLDLVIMTDSFFGPPGPSGVAP